MLMSMKNNTIFSIQENQEEPWIKIHGKEEFLTIGSNDEAEVCEIV